MLLLGLIPACAGKTYSLVVMMWTSRAHPRVCGENRTATPRASKADGSSPRVRGKQLGSAEVDNLAGLIPACAGKTVQAFLPAHAPEAHPRVCGENFMSYANF